MAATAGRVRGFYDVRDLQGHFVQPRDDEMQPITPDGRLKDRAALEADDHAREHEQEREQLAAARSLRRGWRERAWGNGQ
jgi:hypothetical protein